MTELPEEIERAIAAACRAMVPATISGLAALDRHKGDLRAAITAALAKERERCAREIEIPLNPPRILDFDTLEWAADTIRALKEKP
jgi:hypothetical protein